MVPAVLPALPLLVFGASALVGLGTGLFVGDKTSKVTDTVIAGAFVYAAYKAAKHFKVV